MVHETIRNDISILHFKPLIMEIILSSTVKGDLVLITESMRFKGFECGEIHSKKKYWLFGSVTYYAELKTMTIEHRFALGGISHNRGGEFIVPKDNPMFFSGGIDAAKAGEDLARAIRDIHIGSRFESMPGFINAANNAVNSSESESIPSQFKYLKGIEKEAVESQNFEMAATIRDRIKSLKNQKA